MNDVLPGREFRKLFSRRSVQAVADVRSFERGLAYGASGRVGKRAVTENSVTAKVRGSSSYKVKLWVDDGRQGYTCSCPVGAEGRFCKHAVAVALVVTGAVADAHVDKDVPIDLRGYLTSLEQGALVDLVLEHADDDDLFDARLRLRAARATEGSLPTAAFRQAIDEAFVTNDYVDYRDMYAYTSNVHEVLTTLRGLLDDGHAMGVIALAEHAIDRAEDALGYVDDSDGYMSGIAEELQDLHLDACLAARPDPVALATTLFERELHAGDLDVFHNAAAAYAEVLGEPGLTEYRRRAQRAWDALPALGPDDERSWDSHRYRITRMMQSLAEARGDVDAVVGVLARDQSSPFQFVLIAERLSNAGRYDEALAWAEKGLGIFAFQDSRLVDAAAEEYHRAGRGGDAVALAWRGFEERPSSQEYERLSGQAQRAGVWAGFRDRALATLRARVEADIAAANQAAAARPNNWAMRYGPARDASDLVAVFLFEGEVEQAWTEAKAAGCSRTLWLELAQRREQDQPADAIPIWQGEVERAIDMKKNHAYAEAVTTIARIRGLMNAAGQGDGFPAYTARLRVAHKAKRNLMKLFDERQW